MIWDFWPFNKFKQKKVTRDPCDILLETLNSLQLYHFETLFNPNLTSVEIQVCWLNIETYTSSLRQISRYLGQNKLVPDGLYVYQTYPIRLSSFFLDDKNYYVILEVALEQWKRATHEFIQSYHAQEDTSIGNRNKQVLDRVYKNVETLITTFKNIPFM